MGDVPVRRPRWVLIPLRVALVTILLTLMSFCVTLLLGILSVIVRARLRGLVPDMPYAYKHIALPVALVVGAIVLVLSATMEVRHYRQARVLADIERAS